MRQFLILIFLLLGMNLQAAHFENIIDVTMKVEDQSYNLRVTNVKFNGQEIKLDDPDMFKPRKETQFRLPPGRYNLTWTTEKGASKWTEGPAKVHEKILVLESGDTTVRVNIKGEEISLY